MQSSRFRELINLIGLLLVGIAPYKSDCSSALSTPVDDSRKSSPTLAAAVPLPFEKVLPGPVTDYEIVTASGDFAREYLLRTFRLPAEGFRYVQKLGRSSNGIKPWLLVRNVETGEGVAVSLAYSGNWILAVEPRGENTVLRAATSPASLAPFDTIGGLPIPGALVAEFSGDWDHGAQPIVRYIRKHLLRDMGEDWPPVQYNTWYADYDRLSQKAILAQAKAAAEMGCELFTIDAGWYGGTVPEAGWVGALGDWTVNHEKLPDGLEPIAAEVRRLGMKCGLWIEIERVSPNSPVGREHPDWFLRDGEKPFERRGSYTLDFGNPQVVAWAKSQIDRLVADYKLDYLKMDFNTNLQLDSERFAGVEDVLYRHYRGLAELWRHLRAEHPDLIVENCSSGSLRHDVMTAAMTDTHWVSDNVNPNMCLAMNHGATYLFPPETCSHWTIVPPWGLKKYASRDADHAAIESSFDPTTQFTVNMMGHLGLSGRIQDWDALTRKIAAERIALYKQIRPIMRKADVYHLTAQANPDAPKMMQAALYVDPETNRAVLFAYQANDPRLEATVRLKGLRPDRRYRVRGPENLELPESSAGHELIENGLKLRFPNRGASAVILLTGERGA
ncbi:MAG TPA: hypothetical protein DD670_13260 [Planctomycetaceae bacterium]|nr:hypothetical protein [Planctomycetaceae bacterium]